MIFSLEAIQAKHGDALLLHYGSAQAPRLAVIDGGPRGVYRRQLRPRLNAIRQARSPETVLPIRLLMVSHMDEDHITGVLDLTDDLLDYQDTEHPLPYAIRTVWHNSFDEIVGNRLRRPFESLGDSFASGREAPPRVALSRAGAGVAMSVRQGRLLRNHLQGLDLPVNRPFRTIVARGNRRRTVRLGSGLTFTIIAPSERRIRELRSEWDAQLARLRSASAIDRLRIAADYVDQSVFNLASIVVLARFRRRTMLLTGDARGDDILEGLTELGLMRRGKMHVDILKLPHHGSDRNVETDFFRRVTARHYVVSGDGKYGNPEIATFQMLSDARGQQQYTIHLTNREQRLVNFFRRERRRGRRYGVAFRRADRPSLRIDLLGAPRY
ncbi:MAG: hypothetical protein JSW71_05595 [Gemmatimonadota bacterium]|nr:MAG: hypothetical protein JSW71_05595 [Gemmatimonadota bacterium]